MVQTYLYFTQSMIYEAIEAIKDYSKQSKIIKSREVHWDENLKKDIDIAELDEIFVDIPLHADINEQLDRIFSIEYNKNEWNEDDLHFAWSRTDENKRIWELEYWGRPLCKNYEKILNGDKTCSESTCPPEFAKVCHELIDILKKYQ